MYRNTEKKKNVNFGHKTSLGMTEFYFKFQNSRFYPLISACYQVYFQKNLKNRFREKFKIEEIYNNEIYA